MGIVHRVQWTIVFYITVILCTIFAFVLQHHNGRGGAEFAVSQNGYQVIWNQDSAALYRWHVPGEQTTFLLRRGPVGFVLAAHAYWYARTIGGFDLKADDHGYSLRRIGGTSVWSNHASATAIDINALNHPQGVWGTYTVGEVAMIHDRLALFRGVIRWGGDYHGTPDEMHWEINAPRDQVVALADWLRTTDYGKLLLKANPKR